MLISPFSVAQRTLHRESLYLTFSSTRLGFAGFFAPLGYGKALTNAYGTTTLKLRSLQELTLLPHRTDRLSLPTNQLSIGRVLKSRDGSVRSSHSQFFAATDFG